MKNSNTVEGLLPPELGAFTSENPSLRPSLLGSLSGRLLLMGLEEEDKWLRKLQGFFFFFSFGKGQTDSEGQERELGRAW